MKTIKKLDKKDIIALIIRGIEGTSPQPTAKVLDVKIIIHRSGNMFTGQEIGISCEVEIEEIPG